MNDTWGSGWFIHDEAEGTYSRKYIVIPEDKNWLDWTFTGKVTVEDYGIVRGIKKFSNGEYHDGEFDGFILVKGKKYDRIGRLSEEGEFEGLYLVKGKSYYEDGRYIEGEFQDGWPYNATSYNADGSVRCYYENGEYKSADR